jgi:hypothetical protein
MERVEAFCALARSAASTQDDAGAATVELELADRVVEARAAQETPLGRGRRDAREACEQ